MKNIDIGIDMDMVILEDIDIDIDFLENINIDTGILKNIDIDKILYRLEYGISNRATEFPFFLSLPSLQSHKVWSWWKESGWDENQLPLFKHFSSITSTEPGSLSFHLELSNKHLVANFELNGIHQGLACSSTCSQFPNQVLV